MIVTIDGPAGAGKSSVSRKLAERIGFQFLDTGAMYRAVTYLALQRNLDLRCGDVVGLAQGMEIIFQDAEVHLGGEDVSEAIRAADVTRRVSEIADNPNVREKMVALQRKIAKGGDYVSEGRDQGTVAFPEAVCKIFLTASPEERARRRCLQLSEIGVQADLKEVLAAQNERDHRDATRLVGPLVKASDAIEVVTDGRSFNEVVDQLVTLVSQKVGR